MRRDMGLRAIRGLGFLDSTLFPFCVLVLVIVAGIAIDRSAEPQTSATLTGPSVRPWSTPTGTLSEDHTGTNIVVATGGTYYPWITAVAGPMVDGMRADVTDAAGDHLIVPIAGSYLVLAFGSYTGGNDDQTRCRVALDGVGDAIVIWERTLGANARIGDANAGGLIAAESGQEFRLECTSNTNGDTLVIHNFQLTAMRVGP